METAPLESKAAMPPHLIDVASQIEKRAAGVIEEAELTLPAGADAALRIPLTLPNWQRAVYFAPFQRHAINPALDLWPEGLNQCQPLPVAALHDVKRGGMFLLLELAEEDYLALLPLTSPRAMASMRGTGRELVLEVSHFGRVAFTASLPLLAYARERDPYAACRRVWETALLSPAMAGVGALRETKIYPRAFEYLGWCSFEQFKLAIDESNMTDVVRALAVSPVPVRWILIDDGHLDDGCADGVETQEGATPSAGNDPATRRLRRAGTHPQRFPRGWAPLVAAARQTKIRWLGAWMNFNGYWGGVDPSGDWPEQVRAALIEIADEVALPRGDVNAAETFWSHVLAPLAEAGFDFLKVDNQAGNLKLYAGHVPNGVSASAANKLALEQIVSARFGGRLINCMAHNGVASFHTPTSAVTRCSEDYKRDDAWRAKHHLHNSFGNMLWLGPTVWGDHDMFHSSDLVAAAPMACSKALSGGPVYLSDHPRDFRSELIMPLCLADGRVLRPEAPALPLPDSIFDDPYESDCAFRVAAPLAHGAVAVACFNLATPDRCVTARIAPSDFQAARRMVPMAPNAAAAVAATVFDQRARRVWLLREESRVTLAPGEHALYTVAPVHDGWAFLGSPDKLLGPAFIAELERHENRCVIRVPEPGRVWVWCPRRVVSEELPVHDLGGEVWEVEFSPALLHGTLQQVDG